MRLRSLLLVIVLHCASFSVLHPQDTRLKSGDEILTLVFAFGCEAYGTKGDFLLDSPKNVFTNDNNDIIVLDRYHIKIYDSKGNGKKIIGGRGQGPGEFDHIHQMCATSPPAYFTVLESSGGYYSIFDNKLKFIDKRRIGNDKGFSEFLEINKINPADMSGINYMFVYGEKEKIYNFTVESKPYFKVAILYDQGGKIKPILYKDDKLTFNDPPYIFGSIFGTIRYTALPGKIVVYSDNAEEDFGDGKKGIYKIHIVSCDDLSERIITKEFTPVKYDGKYLAELKSIYLDRTNKTQRNINQFKMIEEFHNKKKYYNNVDALKSDSTYIFALNYGWLSNEKTSYDVFDVRTGKYISTFQSPDVLGYIRNGYVYEIGIHTSGYKEIRVYKLNPKIYGK